MIVAKGRWFINKKGFPTYKPFLNKKTRKIKGEPMTQSLTERRRGDAIRNL